MTPIKLSSPVMRTDMILGLAVALSWAAPPAGAIELQSATLTAWQDYASGTRADMQSRLAAKRPFLWIDESPDRVQRVRRGETVVAPLAKIGLRTVTHGLIHHWIGAVYIPGATMESFRAVTEDYDRYRDIYKPVVTDSKAIYVNEKEDAFSMIWQRRVLFVNAAIQCRFRAHQNLVDSHRGFSVVDATRLQQIELYRPASQRVLPPDTGAICMRRIQIILRFEQCEGEVFLEIEAMTLTRDIPASLQWLVAPAVKRLSAE
jgi:hypothetical protein